ncbi:FAD-linked oxidoreductase azaL, partial [Colletotrichum shisoi]
KWHRDSKISQPSAQRSTAHDIPFTTCSGGHSTAGTSSSDGGTVIHLELMRDMFVDVGKRLITFGGSCTWKEVDAEAWRHGLATVGGTVSHTGVGGLILGGGQGMLSGQHGVAVDCLVEAEVVLADGSIVTASETENADLFWGLRGAGASFGVVTRFTSEVFPQGRIWSGPLMFPMAKLPELVAWTNAFIERMDERQSMIIGFTYGPPSRSTPLIMVQPFHNGTGKEAVEGAFKGFIELGSHNEHDERDGLPGTTVTAPLELSKWEELSRAFYAYIDAETEQGNDMRASLLGVEIYKKDRVTSVRLGATAYSNRGMYFDVLVLASWTDPDKDGTIRRWHGELARRIKEGNQKGEDDGVGQYSNYSCVVVDVKLGFGDKAKRLVELKSKFDPANRFAKSPWKIAAP